MSSYVNGTVDLANLIPEIWSPLMYNELRSKLILADIFNRDYEGSLTQMGDIVRVNQINAPTGEILTSDKDTFSTEAMTVTQDTITVNKRASASFEFTSLAQLQSQAFERDAQEALVYAIRKQLEDTIIAALVPSTSSPDHDIAPASASDLAAADVAGMRTLLSTAKVPIQDRYLVLAPSYYGDIIQKTTVASRDFIPAGAPSSTGLISEPLFGFTVAEHDGLSADVGYAVHKSALSLVMQQGIRIKISDQHPNQRYGYILSADMVFGLSLFDNKRIVKISN
jgi:hypothetical protein